MRVIHIVPALPPQVNGLGDYAWALAEGLRPLGIASAFLVTGAAAGSPAPPAAPDPVAILPAPDAEALAAAVRGLARVDAAAPAGAPPPLLLLHYVNYAYDPRGCPDWLSRGLARLAAARSELRIAVMFHELYASGPVWRRVFWQQWHQRRLVRELVACCQAVVTNTVAYAAYLRRRAGGVPVHLLPVCSNVGEPASLPGWSQRRPELVVFGSAASRARFYRGGAAPLAARCQALGIAVVHDVGPSVAVPSLPPPLALVAHGILPAEQVGRLLCEVRHGGLCYWPDLLGKSGIFAAYCAHGVVAWCRSEAGGLHPPAGQRETIHRDWRLAGPLDAAAAERQLQRQADWYASHRRADHAALFAALCRGDAG
jgi:hypothetical protein